MKRNISLLRISDCQRNASVVNVKNNSLDESLTAAAVLHYVIQGTQCY
jgi:hypothetical protein